MDLEEEQKSRPKSRLKVTEKGNISMKTKSNYVKRLTVGGLMLAAGVVIPWIFHSLGISEFGKMFLPMHLSVFVAGVFLGQYYGLGIGLLTPLLNSLFGMPTFPMNLIMAFELAAYGFFSGLFTSYKAGKRIRLFGKDLRVILGLILSMLAGRIIYAFSLYVAIQLLGLEKLPKPLSIIASTVTGLPGILLQLILVPTIVHILRKIAVFQD